jgi:hypothetical protein
MWYYCNVIKSTRSVCVIQYVCSSSSTDISQCALGPLCYIRACSIWITWQRSSPMKGELRLRGSSSISKFHHHNINGGAVDDTWRHMYTTFMLNLVMRYLWAHLGSAAVQLRMLRLHLCFCCHSCLPWGCCHWTAHAPSPSLFVATTAAYLGSATIKLRNGMLSLHLFFAVTAAAYLGTAAVQLRMLRLHLCFCCHSCLPWVCCRSAAHAPSPSWFAATACPPPACPVWGQLKNVMPYVCEDEP